MFIDNSFKDQTPKVTQQLLNNLVMLNWNEYMLDGFLEEALRSEHIKIFKGMYLNEWNDAIWNPLRKHPKEELTYTTDEDNWNELSYKEKEERLNGIEYTVIKPFINLNEYSLDQLVEYLENKYMFSSSGDAYIINRLIEFYNKHKEKALD